MWLIWTSLDEMGYRGTRNRSLCRGGQRDGAFDGVGGG